MKGAGASVDLLLCGNAVNYALKAQDATGLKFGETAQTRPPQIADDLEKLGAKGVALYAVAEALHERGIAEAQLIGGIARLPQGRIASLYAGYDQIWQW
jgi:hypothetical protein